MSKQSEIMIRNYRLHLVKDPLEEGIDNHARSLLLLNKGTSIHVSNSILRPEIYKYGTQVTNQLAQVFPILSSQLFEPKLPAKAARPSKGSKILRNALAQGRNGWQSQSSHSRQTHESGQLNSQAQSCRNDSEVEHAGLSEAIHDQMSSEEEEELKCMLTR
jgi:hypothetical protein